MICMGWDMWARLSTGVERWLLYLGSICGNPLTGNDRRSRVALERIGGQREGILRAHRIAADHTARDSMRYSIVAAQWPGAKQKLQLMINETGKGE